MPTPLANRVYRRLFAAQVVALLGTGLSTVALALLAYDLAGEDAGAVLGTALALKMVAYVAIAPMVGGLAHRLARKPLLITLDVLRAAAIVCLPFVDALWQIYLLIFVLSACAAGFTPVFQATIPEILPDEAQYTRALSLSRLAYDLENLVSPGLAALALVFLGYDVLFVANAFAFLISALLVRSVTLPRAAASERPEGVWSNLSFGVRAYLATPRLRGLLLLSLAVAAAGAMVVVNTVVYVRDRLGGSESETALVLAASGAGSMVVALLLPRLLERWAERSVMLTGGALLGVGLLLGLFHPTAMTILPLWCLLGAGISAIQTPAGRLLRRSSRDSDRAALFAAQFALSHGCWLVAYPLAGWFGASAGLDAAFLVLATVVIGATLAAALAWPASDPAELEHVHQALDHAHPHRHDEHHQHEHEGWEGSEPHSHPHRHRTVRHRHAFVIDAHHDVWPL
jgi:MFS family permease